MQFEGHSKSRWKCTVLSGTLLAGLDFLKTKLHFLLKFDQISNPKVTKLRFYSKYIFRFLYPSSDGFEFF